MLHLEIQQAQFSESERARFKSLLEAVAQSDGAVSSLEVEFIEHMLPETKDDPKAELQQMWRHSDLLLTTCICLAVLNGRYPIEKARKVSQIAHSMGFSAKKLRKLEEQALRVIRYRGEQIKEDNIPFPPKVSDDRLPTFIQDAPFPELLSQLWYSDAELIQTTGSDIRSSLDIQMDDDSREE